MKIKCILNEIKYEDNIILITSKGDFKIPVKNGTTNIPILNKKKNTYRFNKFKNR